MFLQGELVLEGSRLRHHSLDKLLPKGAFTLSKSEHESERVLYNTRNVV